MISFQVIRYISISQWDQIYCDNETDKNFNSFIFEQMETEMWYNVMDQYAVFAAFDNSRLILPTEKIFWEKNR